MYSYLELVNDVLTNGTESTDRTGTGTIKVFGRQLRFNLEEGFPILTTKKMSLKNIATELLWFIRGDTNINWLKDRGCTIWDEWARDNGDLGPVYGRNWRRWLLPEPRTEYITARAAPITAVASKGAVHHGTWWPEYSAVEEALNNGSDDAIAAEWLRIVDDWQLGITAIDARWIQLKNFVEDVSTLVGYEQFMEAPNDWSLTNHQYGAQCYSRETSIFCPHDYWGFLCSNNTARTPTKPGTKILRNVYHVDQLMDVVEGLKTNPESRRHIISGWDAGVIQNMELPPCHMTQQYQVCEGRLNLMVYQRSVDVGLGLPYNIASYALMLHMMASEVGLVPGDLIMSLGDVHIYNNHVAPLTEQVQRRPLRKPALIMKGKGVFNHSPEDFTLLNYVHHPAIKMEVSV